MFSDKFENQSGITREELHHRNIEIRGYKRSNGLFEVEAQITDIRPVDLDIEYGRKVPAGSPLHQMGVRLVYDIELLVHDVQTFTSASPYEVCPSAGTALKNIIGLRMVAGWSKEVKSRLEKAHNCTHLVELLGPMATVAFQSLSGIRPPSGALDKNGRPIKMDSCFAYASDGDLVKKKWPEL